MTTTMQPRLHLEHLGWTVEVYELPGGRFYGRFQPTGINSDDWRETGHLPTVESALLETGACIHESLEHMRMMSTMETIRQHPEQVPPQIRALIESLENGDADIDVDTATAEPTRHTGMYL